ncbi:LysR family transcriptional regulator [Sesbania bispinosa]|nr:LysR family transcriptional regulator [Sesbania bispinosa]
MSTTMSIDNEGNAIVGVGSVVEAVGSGQSDVVETSSTVGGVAGTSIAPPSISEMVIEGEVPVKAKRAGGKKIITDGSSSRQQVSKNKFVGSRPLLGYIMKNFVGSRPLLC